MTTTAVVQARTGSTRLPGKVLADLAGRPLLGFLLARLATLPVDHLVVATSDAEGDDAIVTIGEGAGVPVVRGDEQDVLGRFVTTLDAFPAQQVVRITADCPLSDPAVITAAMTVHAATGADYVSNSLVRTFPDGLDVEVVSADALRRAADTAVDPVEREHVTPFVYRRTSQFRLRALLAQERMGHLRWTIDRQDDLDHLRTLVGRLPDPIAASWTDVLALLTAAERRRPAHALVPVDPSETARLAAFDADPELVRLGDAALDPPADLTDAARRTWLLTEHDRAVGWVGLRVDDGVGRWAATVPATLGDEVVDLLQRALQADFQVTTLATPDNRPTGTP